jgi:ribosome-binding protein aMBF1 (putative translation factor)
MAEQNTSRWASIRAHTVETTPERRARYARTKRQVLVTRQILQKIDAERERRGMTKADLAHKVGMTPSVLRRLFSSASSNPGLATVVAMLDVLDLDMQVGAQPGRRRAPAAGAQPATSGSRNRARKLATA